MDFVPLLPIVSNDRKTLQLLVPPDDLHITSETAVEENDGTSTSITLDAPTMKPASEGMMPPRIRLDDYYAKVQSVQIESLEGNTTTSESSDDDETPPPPPPPPIRLDDYYARLALQVADAPEEQVEEALPKQPKRKRHKPMNATQQKQAMETLKAKLALYPQPQVRLSQLLLPPVEPQTRLPPPLSTPVTSSTTKVVKRGKATPEHKVRSLTTRYYESTRWPTTRQNLG